jgi:hypothetical protein
MHRSSGSNELESGGSVMNAGHVYRTKMRNPNEHGGCDMAWYGDCIALQCFVSNGQCIGGHASSDECVNGVEVLLCLGIHRTHDARLVCDEVHNSNKHT